MGARQETVADGTTGAVAAECRARVDVAPPRAVLAQLEPGADGAAAALVFSARVLVAPMVAHSAGRDDDDGLNVAERREARDGVGRVASQKAVQSCSGRLLRNSVCDGRLDDQIAPVAAIHCEVAVHLTSNENASLQYTTHGG